MSTDEQALAVIRDDLSIGRAPALVLAEAHDAAKALKDIIDNKKKKVVFNGKTYLENEDWLTVGKFYGLTSRIRETKYVEFGPEEGKVRGFQAFAEAYLVNTGQVVSMAESMCLNDERNWSGKPLFQLMSMAQTRASSRVMRQVLGWVVVLAGYSPTPSEEMDGVGQQFTSKTQRIAGELLECKAFDNCSIAKIGNRKIVITDNGHDSFLAQCEGKTIEVEVTEKSGPKGKYLDLIQIITVDGKAYLESALQASVEKLPKKDDAGLNAKGRAAQKSGKSLAAPVNLDAEDALLIGEKDEFGQEIRP